MDEIKISYYLSIVYRSNFLARLLHPSLNPANFVISSLHAECQLCSTGFCWFPSIFRRSFFGGVFFLGGGRLNLDGASVATLRSSGVVLWGEEGFPGV